MKSSAHPSFCRQPPYINTPLPLSSPHFYKKILSLPSMVFQKSQPMNESGKGHTMLCIDSSFGSSLGLTVRCSV